MREEERKMGKEGTERERRRKKKTRSKGGVWKKWRK